MNFMFLALFFGFGGGLRSCIEGQRLEPDSSTNWKFGGGRSSITSLPERIVFSLTTTRERIGLIEEVLERIVDLQNPIRAHRVYLSVAKDVPIPMWLSEFEVSHESTFKLLKMEKDYGPAAKILAAVREGQETLENTVIVFGDDDILLPPNLISMHWNAHAEKAKGDLLRLKTPSFSPPAAFGTRRITVDSEFGVDPPEDILEATGTISVRASYLLQDERVFEVANAPDACRLSDDYWVSTFLKRAGVRLELLPTCVYDFSSGRWPPRTCGEPFEAVPHIESIGALSSRLVDPSGKETNVGDGGGDWRDQLRRYGLCASIMRSRDEWRSMRNREDDGERQEQRQGRSSRRGDTETWMMQGRIPVAYYRHKMNHPGEAVAAIVMVVVVIGSAVAVLIRSKTRRRKDGGGETGSTGRTSGSESDGNDHPSPSSISRSLHQPHRRRLRPTAAEAGAAD